MPIVKIYRKGVINEELVSIIRTNVRLPERAMGDFRAQIAAVKTGERRFLEMLDANTAATPWSAASKRSWSTARRSRARASREIPDGVYEAESFMDDDGVNVGERVPIRVRVEVEGRPDDGRPHRRLEAGARASTIPARPRAAPAARSRSNA